jgi:hypothetical protein
MKLNLSILEMFKGIGDSPEMGRVLWFLGGVATIVFQGYAIFKGQEFDPLVFAGGFAALLAAGGFGISQKDNGVANAKATSNPAPINVDTVKGDINTENVNVGPSS